MSKYHSRKTIVDGITFDSAAEARRYSELMLMQRAGEITALELQPEFEIIVEDKYIGYYRADFRYLPRSGPRVIEDVKGFRTPVYHLKKKLVEALYNITITEVDA